MKSSETEFISAASKVFSGIGQLLSSYTDAIKEIEDLKLSIGHLNSKIANLNLEICEALDSKAKLEAEFSYFKYSLAGLQNNVPKADHIEVKKEVPADNVSLPSNSQSEIVLEEKRKAQMLFGHKKPPVKKSIKPQPTGFCERCGQPVENPKYRFCSRSCQVKHAHANRRTLNAKPDQQQPEPAAEKEENTQQ